MKISFNLCKKSLLSSFLLLIVFLQISAADATHKTIQKIFTPHLSSEGAGARVRRIIGSQQLPRLDPFLMLDNFFVKLPGGFPDHPHRGFDTVTYMLQGSFFHEDFMGNRGEIKAGDLQWMTAGRGVVHSEMPGSWEEESIGFQLWLNLATKDKFCLPEYQEISKDKIPVVRQDNVLVKVIAGESLGLKGPIVARTPALFLDVELQANTKFEQVIPKGWNSFSYVYEGEAFYGVWGEKVGTYSVAVFNKEDNELLTIETRDKPAKFILIGGLPMNEPVYSRGPFVLSSQSDLEKTFREYSLGQNGFENAPGWRSQIRNMANRNPNRDL